jgi:hypothetical protein
LDLGALQRRLRDAQVQRHAAVSQSDTTARAGVAGLRVTSVGDEMASYFGEGSERGLLVVEADSSWAPLRKGDVILRIDGVAVDSEGLGDALDPRRASRVELLRRARVITVTLHARE